MNLKTLIFTNSDCYKKGDIIIPKGIMVHSTGANNPNLKRYVGPNDGLLGENTNKKATAKAVIFFFIIIYLLFGICYFYGCGFGRMQRSVENDSCCGRPS